MKCRTESGSSTKHAQWGLSGIVSVCLMAGFVSCKPIDPSPSLQPLRVQMDVVLSDPIQPERPAGVYPVELILDEQGFLVSYRMELETELCLERICKRLVATLYWDAIGRFSYLEYPERMPFTKTDHEPFSEADYERLDQILHDQETIIKNYPLNYFVYPQAEGVDAVGSATPQTVQDALVPGAAYTSWALWHWVNGEIVDQLLSETIRRTGPEYWEHCLYRGDADFVLFAFGRIDKADPRYVDACYDLLKRADVNSARLAMDYLTRAPIHRDQLSHELISLLGVHPASSRLILDDLQTLENPPEDLGLKLAERLPTLARYSDVHTVLRILEDNEFFSPQIQAEVQKLLTNSSPFIVRRANEFLMK